MAEEINAATADAPIAAPTITTTTATHVERVEVSIGKEEDGKLKLALGALTTVANMQVRGVLNTVFLGTFLFALAIGWTQRVQMGQAVADIADRIAHERTERVHATALTDAVVQHTEIKALMEATRDAMGASRVMTWGFHNGTESLRGLPFLFVSATAEIDAVGFAPIQDSGQHLPLATVIEWVPDFLAHQCIDRTAEASGPTLRADLEDHGTARVMACPIYAAGQRGEPLGYITASWVKGWSPNDAAAAQRRLQDTATLLGGVLGSYLDKVQHPPRAQK